MKKKIPLARPCLGKEELEAIKSVLKSGILAEGAVTSEFERAFGKYIGVENAVATSSCTTALHLALLVLDIKRPDEVIIPDFTFPATGNVVFNVGAKPVLVDIDKRTYNIDPNKIAKAINRKTKAIIAVHLFGQSASMKEIMEIAEEHDLYVVEDAACGVGATHMGRRVGTWGILSCFSFHPRKILATGEGGMLVTNDNKLAERARILKNHGIKKTANNKQRFIEAGYNFRLNDVASAIGLVQLKKIMAFTQERTNLARKYNEFLRDAEWVDTPYVALGNNHTYQTYCMMIKKENIRDQLINELYNKGIETQIGTYALHLQPSFNKCVLKTSSLQCSENAFMNSLALPMYNGLSEEEQEYVCECLKNMVYFVSADASS